MKRATISISTDLEKALDNYIKQQDAPPALTTVVQAALREYLAHRGFCAPLVPLRITAARRGSGKRDISINHDQYLAGIK